VRGANEDRKKRILLGSSCKTESLQIGHLDDVNKPHEGCGGGRSGNRNETGDLRLKMTSMREERPFQTSGDWSGTSTILSYILRPNHPRQYQETNCHDTPSIHP